MDIGTWWTTVHRIAKESAPPVTREPGRAPPRHAHGATLWTVALQAPLFMEFSRQEYWSGLPCPPSGNLPDPGIEPISPVTPALHF